jgi:hypothetical protein
MQIQAHQPAIQYRNATRLAGHSRGRRWQALLEQGKPEKGLGDEMSKRDSRRLFIRVVCTDMYIDRQTGTKCARHQKFRLGRLPVFVEKDQDGNALPGTECVGYPPDAYVNPPMPAQRCPKCGRTLPQAPRYSDEGGGAWSRIVRHWLDADPNARFL